jgi:excisionase family DNA binding protein
MITTAQAAVILNISRSRILKLIAAGRLPAQKFGRDWLIAFADLDLVKVRCPGRPRDQRKPT